ncbi:hypothetical protein LXD69_07280 [Flavobacterium sediminilitoris]|uniref:Uncharacterized protein n=1 Tax=Flavobacterium sediminilitoris TaxID=2024526 RepID=A0ABY4HRH3_9FLAO|nr:MULTISPECIES: DUF6712 family protein [Flavobacterium]UOX35313.1 hypothetical protein LXD69_07280 [Flavobacterium sediminilitoris]
MAQLINTIEDLKKHIVVSASFDFKKVLPYTKRAERKYIISLIGREQYDSIIIHPYDEDSDAPINLVKLLIAEAAAHFSLLLALPVINLQITNHGLKTTENKDASPADWKDVRDLKRSLIETANEALDSAFEIMEENTADFSEWVASDHYTIFKEGIVRHTKTFNDLFNIGNSRKTFLALKPYMTEVEERFILTMLGQCTLDFLKTSSTDSVVLRSQKLLQMAVVSFTISKAAVAGTFSVTQSSLVVSSEELPWERNKMELDEAKLERLRKDRENSGNEYLKKLKKIIVDNPTIFVCYEDKTEVGLANKIQKLKTGLAL